MNLVERQFLKELSGYKNPKHVSKWLTKNKIRHFIRADGWPAVLESDLEVRSNQKKTAIEPDYSSLDETG